jgi:hypothetical protein
VALQLIAAYHPSLSNATLKKDDEEKKSQKESFVEPILELKEKFNRILRVKQTPCFVCCVFCLFVYICVF